MDTDTGLLLLAVALAFGLGYGLGYADGGIGFWSNRR